MVVINNRYIEKWFYLFRIALISRSFLLSALAFCRDITAHAAAGIQPISVIWRIRQRSPVRILPRRIKDKKGKNIAISVIWIIVKAGAP
jgi:hypothetical protein